MKSELQVGLVVLGAVLALMTGIAVEIVRGAITQRRIRKLLSTLLVDEVQSLIDIFKKLTDDTQKLNFIPLIQVNQIASARQGFDRNRDWIILYRDEGLRRQLFKFYLDVGVVGTECHALESLKSSEKFKDEWITYYDKEKSNLMTKANSLISEGTNLVSELRNHR